MSHASPPPRYTRIGTASDYPVVGASTALHECRDCGSVVSYLDRHDEWHVAISLIGVPDA